MLGSHPFMLDWNLAVIDVAAAWLVVALPRFAQARLLATSGNYSNEQLRALAIGERLSVDPVKHTSIVGSLLVPATLSLAGLPVVAWGKRIESGRLPSGLPRLALGVWIAPSVVYLLQAVVLALFMLLLAEVYLGGAPAAARAGQLCVRLAILNLLPLPPFDSALSLAIWRGRETSPAWLPFAGSALLLAALAATPMLYFIDRQAALAFFLISRIFG